MCQWWGEVAQPPEKGWMGHVAAPCSIPGLLSPRAGGAGSGSVPGPPRLPRGWPRGPGDVPVPGGTGHPGGEDPAGLSSAILWDIQVQSCLSFVLQKENQAQTVPKAGPVEMNPWLEEPQASRAPAEALAPSPCSSCSFPTTAKGQQEQNQAEKWEFPLLFCPDTVCDCRVTPGLRPHPGEICLRDLHLIVASCLSLSIC